MKTTKTFSSKMKNLRFFCLSLLVMILAGAGNFAQAQCPTSSDVVIKTSTDVTSPGANDGTITVQLSVSVNNFELYDNTLGVFVTSSVIETQTSTSVTYTGVYPGSFQVIAFKTGCTTLSISGGPFGFVIQEPAQSQEGAHDQEQSTK